MTAQLPKAIIFDMDDTILSDDASAEKCWRQVCHDQAHRIETCSADELLAHIRQIRRWFWADPDRIRQFGIDLRKARFEILSMAFEKVGLDDDALKDEMADVYMELKADTVEIIPGALDTLQCLKDDGLRLGLITNGNAEGQRAKVRKAGLEPIFDSILIAGEFGASKPDPQVFNHTLECLQAAPGEAWMVGDNLYADIGGAQGVGIYGIWVDWRGSGLPPNTPAIPDRTVRTIVELHPAGTE